MSLALARTHAPGQPEYVLAHSLWVERTPTCVSGRGSGRGEVALPAGVGLSKFGVGTGFGGCDNTKPGSRNLSIHACFSSESTISCRGHWSHRTTGSPGTPRAQQRAPRKARRVARRTRWQHQQARQQLARRREDQPGWQAVAERIDGWLGGQEL
jgi:hypothetical protein